MTGATTAAGATAGENGSGAPDARLEQADVEEVRAYREYANDESMIEQAFDDHIDAVARTMERTDVSPPSSLSEAEDVSVFPESKDGQASAHIVARFHDDEVLLHIYPQANRAYAHVGAGEQKQLADPSEGVQPMGCYEVYECKCPSACGWYSGYEDVYSYCRFPDGSTSKERIGGHCGCDDSDNPCSEVS